MDKKEIQEFKKALEKEKEIVEKELGTVGKRNPENPNDWEASPTQDLDVDTADRDDVADSIESYEENSAILSQLEIKLEEINDALKKIDDGKYGICEIGGEIIEKERLQANPAARTCEKHM